MALPTKFSAPRFLFRLAHAIYYHRRWFFYPQALLVLVCLSYASRYLEFHTSRNDLVGGDKQYHRNYLQFKAEFPLQDDLVVVVESEDAEKNRQFVERLGTKLEAKTNLFSSIFYKGDFALMGRKALLFFPEEGLKDLEATLSEYRPFLEQFAQATNLVSLFDMVNSRFRTATREAGAENEAFIKTLPALQRIVEQGIDALRRRGSPPSPGIEALFGGGAEAQEQMYVTFGGGRIYLVIAQAAREEANEAAIQEMRRLIRETQTEVPGLNVGLTGEPVLELDEMVQSQRDTTVATIVSLVAVAMIFIYGYHETGRPLKATICLLVGLVYTMGFTTLAVGHLNILTITFVPILVGLAIDFGVHLITRYEEELRHGRSERIALEKAMVNTGMGIFTGAFTTAGAFFAMAAADFKGVQEMGIICGGGMIVCLIPMMTLLPVLLLRGRQNVLDHEMGETLDRKAAIDTDRRARLENAWLRRPGLIIAITAFLCIIAIPQARNVRFDYNLLNMQSAGLPAVIYQDKLIESSTKSVLFAAVIADSAEQATNLAARLTRSTTVASVETMATFLMEDPSEKLALIRKTKQALSGIDFPPLDSSPVDVGELTQTLWSFHGYLGLAIKEVAPAAKESSEEALLLAELGSLRTAVKEWIDEIRVREQSEVSAKLARFQVALFKDARDTFRAIQNQDASGPLRVEDIPAPLRKRFIGIEGKHLIQVYPAADVWERSNQEAFVQQLRQVEPEVTGTPVQLLEYTSLLKTSFQDAAKYSLCAIAVLVFLHFRKISCIFLALLPVGVGFLWLLGVMGLAGLTFNPANIMTLPLIVGIGVTNGIHILNRFAEEEHPRILARSTGKAVLVSGLTTVCGFGSLILAQHRGIQSLGYVMATGVAACMVVALTFLPALLNLLSERGWTIKKTQRDNARSPLGREEPR